MKRILVTGGAGFIGSHLCERLLNEGNEVVCLDNFFTGSKDNIIHLMDNKRFELIRHDIIEPILLEVDQIYNLASPASPIHYQYNPVKTTKTNVMGTINMLGLAKRVRARILQASTSEVYGDPTEHPQKEDYWGNVNPIGPRSCYDEGKRVAETLMMDYYRQNNVAIRIVRIFNTYGPRMALNDGRVVSNFIVQALKGEDITVYGEGNQTRSFCYVSDLVDGLIRMMNQGTVPDLRTQRSEVVESGLPPAKKESFIGPVNIGNPHEHTILEFAEKIIAMTGSKSRLSFNPLPQDDPKQRQPDITLAKEKLGWSPRVSIDEGLGLTINYFKMKVRG
ncbi:MAG: SDR family oxidoreductase [Deltaproteobacteria bacterium]|nr:SDR family oxidoreductase [Deltaproteobacteria bacterium]